jgi:hypothetical protein
LASGFSGILGLLFLTRLSRPAAPIQNPRLAPT